ncbi:uncharacterized protein MELLADRAFT_95698 [Melampsora larici-populina 98AG31]|uniref:Rad60/SUMO-like domain-containing protein n=1 Tax=Melampsora larici-populina (strain 98AG31 / pathotype 3-4-7) TaxID=747676 RepID=F4SAA8_MELLP|nr:uncharacterized protein MELLADRAFT_95698 [Melampsora larici-populina 98AG31]EGF98437.1 hypothetical protein MELLADRAFT_95698 [Melampsora larici-populina 98AG31]
MGPGTNVIYLKVKQTCRFDKIMDVYAKHVRMRIGSLGFRYDDLRVREHFEQHPQDTPEDLEMADGDVIRVDLEQVGGRCRK